MNVSEYYENAKRIGELVKDRDSSILNALKYDEEDNHPSSWVPNVQKSLLCFYKMFPNVEEAEEVFSLYIEGELLERCSERNIAVKVGVSCLIIGMVLGRFVWA